MHDDPTEMRPFELKPARDLALPPAERWRVVDREDGIVASSLRYVWRSCSRAFFRVAYRLEIRGAEHLPTEPPFVLVANHTSHLDALVLSSILPVRMRDVVCPLAAGDVFFESAGRSAFSALVLNALPVWRKSVGHRALATLRERLTTTPTGYVLFPEGTRSRTGELLEFKPGIGMLVAGTEVPVIPCHIAGGHEAWPPERKLPRPGRLVVTIGPPRTFADERNRKHGWTTVAETLQADVARLANA